MISRRPITRGWLGGLETIGKRITQLVAKNSARFVAQQKDVMEEEKKLAELEKNAREAEDTEALLVDECAKLAKESDALIAQNETIEELIAKQKSINLELEVKLDGLRKASALKPEQQQVDGVRQGGYKVPWETLGNNRFMHAVIKQVGKKLAGLGWQVNMARETTIFM